MNGKELRLARLISPQTKKTCIVAIDHGTTFGPIKGLENVPKIITQLVRGKADIIILHKGLLRMVCEYPDLAKGRFIMHLSVSTALSRDKNSKVVVSSVEEAISLGADGVSVHVNIGTDSDPAMIKDFGRVSEECLKYGMPLLSMMYSQKNGQSTKEIAHAARLGQELGADIVKVSYPGTGAGIAKVVEGVQIPVVIAGGPKSDNPASVLKMIDDAIKAGAAGVSMGRNIFQHKEPELITKLISDLVHGKLKLQECQDMLEKPQYYN